MELYLRRSQRQTGTFKVTMMFCLDARVQLTPDEQANVAKYKLGDTVLYNSERTKQHLDRGEAANDGSVKGAAKAFVHLALAKMSLNISINSLTHGQRIECKDLDELMGAEEAMRTACHNIRNYLDLATTFDGREEVVEYKSAFGAAQQPVAA